MRAFPLPALSAAVLLSLASAPQPALSRGLDDAQASPRYRVVRPVQRSLKVRSGTQVQEQTRRVVTQTRWQPHHVHRTSPYQTLQSGAPIAGGQGVSTVVDPAPQAPWDDREARRERRAERRAQVIQQVLGTISAIAQARAAARGGSAGAGDASTVGQVDPSGQTIDPTQDAGQTTGSETGDASLDPQSAQYQAYSAQSQGVAAPQVAGESTSTLRPLSETEKTTYRQWVAYSAKHPAEYQKVIARDVRVADLMRRGALLGLTTTK